MRPANLIPVVPRHRNRAYGADDPTILRWDRFRTVVRELLADEPSTHSMRNCARRMDAYVLAAAEHETTTRQQSHTARDAA